MTSCHYIVEGMWRYNLYIYWRCGWCNNVWLWNYNSHKLVLSIL